MFNHPFAKTNLYKSQLVSVFFLNHNSPMVQPFRPYTPTTSWQFPMIHSKPQSFECAPSTWIRFNNSSPKISSEVGEGLKYNKERFFGTRNSWVIFRPWQELQELDVPPVIMAMAPGWWFLISKLAIFHWAMIVEESTQKMTSSFFFKQILLCAVVGKTPEKYNSENLSG